MLAVLVALTFSAAFAASILAIYVTIQPRLGYIRYLLTGSTVEPLAPATPPRARLATRPAAVSSLAKPLRAAA